MAERPIDVKLELRNAAQFLRDDGWTERAEAVEQVAAAVAELIQKARAVTAHGDERTLRIAIADLRASLSRVQGSGHV